MIYEVPKPGVLEDLGIALAEGSSMTHDGQFPTKPKTSIARVDYAPLRLALFLADVKIDG